MSAVTVTDALARHFREKVAGTKEAYSTGVTLGSVGLPGSIFDTPVVICFWTGVTTEPGSFERTHWTISADAYFSGADTANAYATYVAYVDTVRTSLRTNWDLFGACTQISRWTGGPPEDLVVDKMDLVRVPFTFDILEAGPQVYGKTAP
jgi:hypothetical protein